MGARAPFVPLGTDGFGRTDTREALRRVLRDRQPATSWSPCCRRLAAEGEVEPEVVAEAIAHYGIDPERPDPRAADLS